MDASIFFSIAGASLVEQFYKKSCQPVAGAACYKLDDAAGTILTFTDSHQASGDRSSSAAFHCWTLCDGYIIDFMAPLFPESLQAVGVKGSCSRKMFQKPREAMADSPLLMHEPGEFYLLPDVALTKQVMQDFFANPVNGNLVNMCAAWYRKPPREIPKEISMQGNDGSIAPMALSRISLTGAW